MLRCFEFSDATSSLCACTYTPGGYVLCLHRQVHVVRACQPDAQIALHVSAVHSVGHVSSLFCALNAEPESHCDVFSLHVMIKHTFGMTGSRSIVAASACLLRCPSYTSMRRRAAYDTCWSHTCVCSKHFPFSYVELKHGQRV